MLRPFVVFVVLLLAGCVGGERRVEITANVRVGVFENGRALASGERPTPTLNAGSPHTLTLEAEGYEPETVTFTPRASGDRVALYVASCVLFPPVLIMLPERLSSGALNDFEPDRLTVRLRRKGERP